MFKTTLTLAISSLITVASFNLSAASLDVHGDIKINGKTVIDNTGKFVTQDDELIDFDAYQPTEKKVIKLKQQDEENESIYTFYYDDTGYEYQETHYYDGELMFSLNWEKVSDNSRITKGINNWSTPTNYTATDTIKHDTSYSAKLGDTIANFFVYDRAYTEHSDSTKLNKTDNIQEVVYLTPLVKTTYDFKGETLTDCVIYEFDAPWLQDSQLRTICKGYGIVQFGDYKLEAIE
ncbi:hypothetical protein [Photobacterium lucens]|uniref:hypothetical protein n=1 Tax=Photobacterium lucens TaxID=2562949 RepID=UPI001370CD8A|nr:hypothetical protein [Photobacterium lucens]MBP2698569.1 hypothetical protein [Vibrio parahaemolyticus]MZG55431.1 hypothetical protein [Photobacterium lucens]MZG81425.1 hypothetical protein [Photobacterium lucens]